MYHWATPGLPNRTVYIQIHSPTGDMYDIMLNIGSNADISGAAVAVVVVVAVGPEGGNDAAVAPVVPDQ